MALRESRLLDLLRFDGAEGTIRWKHRRMLLLDADAMGLLRRELINTLGSAAAKRILTRFGYAYGYRDALTSKELLQWKDQHELWELGPWLLTQEGAALVRVLRSRIDSANNIFEVEAEWFNSYEAEQHCQHIEPISDSPVCWTLTGYGSGHSTALFGREVFYYEKECLGKGDKRCLVVGISADDTIEEARNLKALYKVENIETELSHLLVSLEQKARELQSEREKVGSLEIQVAHLQEAITQGAGTDELVGSHPKFRHVIADVARVAPTNTTVLIYGETGTGKELIARAIHARSDRKNQPMVTVNCAALPHALVESELFGHEKGAFTGALARKPGRFEIANGGTIFLDEVGELPLDTQAKLLRVLQEGEFQRLGGTQTIRVDVRAVTATNRRLDELVAEGKFRSDLYYRLNVFPITVPSLTDRPEDIPLLANYFVQRFKSEFGKNISRIDRISMKALMSYRWPGNIRELEHVIERAVLISEDSILRIPPLTGFSPELASSWNSEQNSHVGRVRTLAEAEKEHISEVVQMTKGLIASKGGAAEVLGVPASTLRNRMKKHGIKS
jgi:transcriptional regulator with GAF, ATPase, and Fis domain/predicted hydrocarbon binding protein